MKLKSGVARELFKNYILGYIIMIIIMFFLFVTTLAFIIINRMGPVIKGFESINEKLVNNYKDITEEELAEVNGFIILVNDEHYIEYSKGNVIKEFEKMTMSDYMKLFDVVGEFEYFKELETMVAMQSDMGSILIKSKDGEEYSVSYKFIEGDSKLIVFGVPYNSIYKYNKFNWETNGKSEVISSLLINILILLLLVSVFAKFTSRKFIKPIRILKDGMKDITDGNYGKQLVIKRKNEFKDLAEGFNLMSKTIKDEKEENERLQQERNKLILHISHDLKNPLAAVLGYSEILSENENLSHKEKLEYLNIIRKNSKRANKIITDLFDLSILESNDYKLNTKLLDVNEVIREIVADYIPELENKNFNYEFDICEEEQLLEIDEVKFTRAISNLIDNSIKYNEKNTTLSIISKNVSKRIEIIISDNGKGISSEAKKTIFEAFMRDDKARNSATGGTGIGLTITKSIIEKHGGTIELIDSDVGMKYRIII